MALLIRVRTIVANLVYCSVGPSLICGLLLYVHAVMVPFTSQQLSKVLCNMECNLTVFSQFSELLPLCFNHACLQRVMYVLIKCLRIKGKVMSLLEEVVA